MKILSKQDFKQNESENFVIDNLSEAPLNPIIGQIYYNTTDKRAYVYDSQLGWLDISLEKEVSIETNEPTDRDAQIWINPNEPIYKNSYDALPVGSIIDYSGTTVPKGYIKISESDSIMKIQKTYGTATLTGDVVDSLEGNSTYNAPSIKAVNRKVDGEVLYSNDVGSNTTINLDGNLLEGKLLSVYFEKGNNVGVATFPIIQTDSIISLTLSSWFASKSVQLLYKSCSLSVTNNTITHLYGGYVNILSGAVTQADENEIYITKVIMFK